MIKLGNDTEVAFMFSEDPQGKRVCRVRVRNGSKNETLEPDKEQLGKVLGIVADFAGVKLGRVAAVPAPAKCDREHVDLEAMTVDDIVTRVVKAKRAKLAPIEEQAARIRAEIEQLEAMAQDGEAIEAEPEAVDDVPIAPRRAYRRRGGGVSQASKIRERLAKEPGKVWQSRELAKAVGVGLKVCSRALHAMLTRGEIERVGHGQFRKAA